LRLAVGIYSIAHELVSGHSVDVLSQAVMMGCKDRLRWFTVLANLCGEMSKVFPLGYPFA
jgi:hypothetical protein